MSDLCLVTGGAGFIGSHLVEALTAAGRPVRVFDDFSSGHLDNLSHLQPAPEIISGTLTDPAAVEKAVAGARFVFHLGAMASVAKSLEDPAACHDVCGTGTLHVLNAARKHGVRRVVYAASASAYGDASGSEGQNEDTPLAALSPYAAAKLTGELYMQVFAHTYGLETVRLRFFNVFGPRQRADSPYSGVIAIFTGLIAAGRTPTIHGDGKQTRDFVYVADAVQAMLRAAEVKGRSGSVYNVGTGRSVTVLQLVEALNHALGTNVKPAHGQAREGDVRFSCARIDRIRRELAYQPAVSFEEGIKRTLEWYQSDAACGLAAGR